MSKTLNLAKHKTEYYHFRIHFFFFFFVVSTLELCASQRANLIFTHYTVEGHSNCQICPETRYSVPILLWNFSGLSEFSSAYFVCLTFFPIFMQLWTRKLSLCCNLLKEHKLLIILLS